MTGISRRDSNPVPGFAVVEQTDGALSGAQRQACL